jgi:hypothetical protein
VIGTHNGTISIADYLFRRWKPRRLAEVDSLAAGGIPLDRLPLPARQTSQRRPVLMAVSKVRFSSMKPRAAMLKSTYV